MSNGQAAFENGELAAAEDHFRAAAQLAEGFESSDPRRALTEERVAQLDIAMIHRVLPTPKPLDLAATDRPEKPAAQAATDASRRATADAKAYSVHLASFRSAERAKRGWRELQQAFPELLGAARLTLERADLGESGVFQRVLAGPFATRAQAKQLCVAVKAEGHYCQVVKRRSAG